MGRRCADEGVKVRSGGGVGVVTCRSECAIVGAWAWLCVSVGALLWRLWVVGCRRYVADDESELIGINQNQSEKIGLILISSDMIGSDRPPKASVCSKGTHKQGRRCAESVAQFC